MSAPVAASPSFLDGGLISAKKKPTKHSFQFFFRKTYCTHGYVY